MLNISGEGIAEDGVRSFISSEPGERRGKVAG